MGLQMKYFVLEPSGNNVFAQASREAMLKYAEIIKTEDPMFAKGVEYWVADEKVKIGVAS